MPGPDQIETDTIRCYMDMGGNRTGMLKHLIFVTKFHRCLAQYNLMAGSSAVCCLIAQILPHSSQKHSQQHQHMCA